MRFFWKAAAAEPGAVHTWADGRQRRKVGNLWVLITDSISASRRVDDRDVKAEKMFDEAVGLAWAGLGVVEHLEDKYGVSDFDGLKKLIQTSPKGQASKVFRSTKDYVDSLTIPTKDKQVAADRFGRALIGLRDLYAGPKQQLTVKVKSKKGKTKYVPKDAPQAAFKPSKIKSAKAKLGGWSDMSKMPTIIQLRAMVGKGTAKITYGKPTAKRKWEVVQRIGREGEISVPFKENAKGITVTLRQSRKSKQRTARTAVVVATIPYPYARQFIEKQISSLRAKNALVGQLTRSAGYKKAAS